MKLLLYLFLHYTKRVCSSLPVALSGRNQSDFSSACGQQWLRDAGYTINNYAESVAAARFDQRCAAYHTSPSNDSSNPCHSLTILVPKRIFILYCRISIRHEQIVLHIFCSGVRNAINQSRHGAFKKRHVGRRKRLHLLRKKWMVKRKMVAIW
jgi:hypothetical protein